MANSRRSLSNAEELALTTQVEGVCPLCGSALFRRKGGREYKRYEIAHIYPLNPTAEEEKLLAGLKRLSDDPNHLDNLIPLCVDCHRGFDKPRTAREYLDLLDRKQILLSLAEQRKLQNLYELQDEVSRIIDALDCEENPISAAQLEFDAKSVDLKFDSTMPPPLRRKIKRDVNDFFTEVRERFRLLDRERPGVADLISVQVRTFYKAQKYAGWTQQQIFHGVADWIAKRSKAKTREAAEIVAAFFVQNCEVFE